jgi:signal transduction histidine kinase
VKKPSISLRLAFWYFGLFVLAQAIFGFGTWYVVRDALAKIGAQERAVALARFNTELLLVAPLLALGGALLCYVISRCALAPVEAVTRTVGEIDGRSLDQRLRSPNSGDELERLSDAVNEMLARLESSFSRITNFSADASDELRMATGAIQAEAESVLRRSRGEAEYREALRRILLEAERTTCLIDELLALARADSGRQRLQVEPINLRDTLQEIARGWRQVANVRGMQFTERLMHSESRVVGDRAALRRVFDILVDNAFKFTPASKGSISLSAEEVAGRAVISVQDNGIGIADHEQDRIFQRFYRVDKERSRDLGGAGLGLSIAQWIVEQHHGRILVESTLGAGAIFRVELPLAPVNVAAENSVRQPAL